PEAEIALRVPRGPFYRAPGHGGLSRGAGASSGCATLRASLRGLGRGGRCLAAGRLGAACGRLGALERLDPLLELEDRRRLLFDSGCHLCWTQHGDSSLLDD